MPPTREPRMNRGRIPKPGGSHQLCRGVQLLTSSVIHSWKGWSNTSYIFIYRHIIYIKFDIHIRCPILCVDLVLQLPRNGCGHVRREVLDCLLGVREGPDGRLECCSSRESRLKRWPSKVVATHKSQKKKYLLESAPIVYLYIYI